MWPWKPSAKRLERQALRAEMERILLQYEMSDWTELEMEYPTHPWSTMTLIRNDLKHWGFRSQSYLRDTVSLHRKIYDNHVKLVYSVAVRHALMRGMGQ